MEFVKLEPFVIDRDIFLKGSCKNEVKFVRVVNKEKTTDLISTVQNKFIIDLSSFSSKCNYYLEIYNCRKFKIDTIEIPVLETHNKIVKVSPFVIGKDRRLNIECSGDVFRVQVISGKRMGARAGLTDNKISYYIGDLIRSKNEKTKVVAIDELDNILDEVEVDVNFSTKHQKGQTNLRKLELLKLYNSMNSFEGLDYKSDNWNNLVKALAKAKYLYDTLVVIDQEMAISIDELKKIRDKA